MAQPAGLGKAGQSLETIKYIAIVKHFQTVNWSYHTKQFSILAYIR